MISRGEFLGAAAAAIAARRLLRACDSGDMFDPAQAVQSQSLRVLLGSGTAQRLDEASFLYEGRRYRGSFSVTAQGQVVTTVPLEQYLYSVVPREMPYTWPAAALQAQAIVARTYVLQRSNPNRAYDLVPSEADQVYTGMDAEQPQSSAAVDVTAGQAVRYAGQFAQVMYSSCCGGHTESNASAWGGAQLPYLVSVPCGYCKDSPWYTWSHEIPLARFVETLGSELQSIGEIDTITLDGTDASGRSNFWLFGGSLGTQRLKAEQVRLSVGTRILPSLLVRTITLAPPQAASVHVEGGGLGHGVGLCQWGARGLAQSGAGAAAILRYYYPGTDIGND